MLAHFATVQDWKNWKPNRGEIYLVDLGDGNIDCEQQGLRPFLLISNNIGNTNGSIVVGCPISTARKVLPIHVPISSDCGMRFDSYIMTEHIRSISKRRFFSKGTPILVGVLSEKKTKEVEYAIKLELGLTS